jgi:chromosome segregation ATPase
MSSGYPPFDQYNDEFRSLVRQIERRLHEAQDVSDLLHQCEEELLPQMKIEARGAPNASLKQDLLDIYQACQMQLTSYKTLHDKAELFELHDKSTSAASHKDRMLSTRDQVSSQNSQLENSLRSIRETEEVAAGITEELGRNRKSLENAHNNVGELSGMMTQANGHLKSVMRKWF